MRACHLNHCLRGEESDRDEQLVRTMCEQYGIPLELRGVEVKALARERGVSIEVAAREARYAFFDELAEKYRCKIATAHTLSDAAETVLLNLARGTGHRRAVRHPAGARGGRAAAHRLHPAGDGGLLRGPRPLLRHRQHQPDRPLHPQPHPATTSCRSFSG